MLQWDLGSNLHYAEWRPNLRAGIAFVIKVSVASQPQVGANVQAVTPPPVAVAVESSQSERRFEMSSIKMPGFTADASLYKASGHYQQQSVSAAVGFGIQPALRRVETESTCGNCVCDQGQCCSATAAGCKCTSCGTTTGGSGGGVLTRGFLL